MAADQTLVIHPLYGAIAGPPSVCPGQSAKYSVTQDGGLRRISCVEIGAKGNLSGRSSSQPGTEPEGDEGEHGGENDSGSGHGSLL